MTSKFTKILEICLLVISLIGLVVFFIYNSNTGLYTVANEAEALATTGMLDIVLFWAYALVIAAIVLVVVLSIINMAGNKKSLKKTGFLLLIAVVLIGLSYLLASGDPIAVNMEVQPTHATLKMTDTLLNLSYALVVIALLALVWGMASKKTPEINGGSMADISFLMLIFFLMVSTMDPETGLARRLPPMPPENAQLEDLKVNRRNMLDVGGQVILSDAQLEEIIIEFLTNPNDRSDLPSKTVKNIEGFGEYPVSEGVISLQNDRQSLYSKYIEITDVIVRAINKVRDDFSIAHFGAVYNDLPVDKQDIVREAIPNRLSEAEPLDVTKQ